MNASSCVSDSREIYGYVTQVEIFGENLSCGTNLMIIGSVEEPHSIVYHWKRVDVLRGCSESIA